MIPLFPRALSVVGKALFFLQTPAGKALQKSMGDLVQKRASLEEEIKHPESVVVRTPTQGVETQVTIDDFRELEASIHSAQQKANMATLEEVRAARKDIVDGLTAVALAQKAQLQSTLIYLTGFLLLIAISVVATVGRVFGLW